MQKKCTLAQSSNTLQSPHGNGKITLLALIPSRAPPSRDDEGSVLIWINKLHIGVI
jgi:hypothetical protein